MFLNSNKIATGSFAFDGDPVHLGGGIPPINPKFHASDTRANAISWSI